ncbi:MAG TPA: YtxH domain-containing protein [Panacibacter sp.]|nr:YtxH domain-containing protein [Panacibacter sp.]HNP46478.1 YtxH domain-containing protein [Panacibacter sp.]
MEWQSFLKGMLAGAVVGILFAPDSGKATRKKIARKTSDLKDSLEETYDQFVDEISQQVGKVADKAKDLIDKGRSSVEDITDAASS